MTSPKPTPTPQPSPSSALAPSAEAQRAAASVPTTTGQSARKTGLTGVPVGTDVVKGVQPRRVTRGSVIGVRPSYAKTQYAPGDGMRVFATLNNQEKIALLTTLTQIPGLYSAKVAPTQDYLLRLASANTVPIRSEDARALEDVMRYADTIGDDYQTAARFLIRNPEVAQGFFDLGGTKAGRQRKISLTPADALALELEQSVLDYLDVKISKQEKAAYAKKINELETKRGGALTSLERNQVLTDAIQEKARQLYKDEEGRADSMLTRRGALGGTFNLLKQTYNDYGIAANESTIYKQAIQSIRSKQALDNTLSKIKLQAEVAMPALKSYIQQGLSPREALGNYLNLYSRIYDVPENQVDLTKLAPVYSGDKIMPFTDWQKYIYTMPDFQNTRLYKEQRLSDAQALIRNFIG